MKLHLPNRLRKVLLNSMVLATVFASSTAYGYSVDITRAGHLYAGAHTFDFAIGEDATISGDLLSYSGDGDTNGEKHTWCRYVLEEDDSGNIKLVFKRTDGGGTLSDSEAYSFTFVEGYTTLERDVAYTIKHDGKGNDDGGATIGLYQGETLIATMGPKNCNMNGTQNNNAPLTSIYNNTYNAHEYTWKATGEIATLDYTSENWDNAYGFTTLLQSDTQRGDVIFAAGENLAKTVEVDGTIRVDRVTINDNYTFTAKEGSATIDANSVTIADGKKVTLDSGTTLLGIHISGYKDMAETVVGSGRLGVVFATDNNHNNGITLGDDFTGTLSIQGGKMDLSGFSYGEEVVLELVSGQVWNNATINNEVLLSATDIDSSYDFAYSTITINGKITGNYLRVTAGGSDGSLTLTNASNKIEGILVTGRTLAISGGKIGYVKATGGTVNLTGTTATIGEWDTELTFDGTHVAGIYAKGDSVINIGNGTDESMITAARLEMGDTEWVGNDKRPNATGSNIANGGTLNVKNNATLLITGDDVSATSSDTGYHQTAFIVGEWGAKSTLNISGTLLAKNASVANGDATGVINVKNGGLLAVKGLKNQKDTSWGTITLNLEDGGTLILGSNGINTQRFNSKLGAGIIGISADATIAENLALGNSSIGTTFDTTKYVWSEDGSSITQGTEGGTLTISGVISDYTETTGEGESAVTTTTAGKLVKVGAGELKLNGENTYSGGTDINAGSLVAATGASLGTGGVTISGGKLEITNAGGDAKVEVAKLAASNTSASITDNGESGVQGSSYGTNYGIGYSNYTIENAEVAVTSQNDVTISNQLRNVALTNSGTGTVTAGNGYNYYTDINAINGNIHLKGIGNTNNKDTQKALNSLAIGDGKTVGAHSTWNVGIDAVSSKATLTVAETATFGAGANLHANLTLNNGAVLTLGEEGLNMNNSVLSLGTSLTLDEATVRRIMNLAEDGVVALFTHVSELILGEQHYTAGSLTADNGGVALSEVFSLENMPTELTAAANTSYYLGFDGNGMVYAAQIVPEPTTATLSLLALAALAARRRRATR